jgi:tRNA pseudouridine55 synthase
VTEASAGGPEGPTGLVVVDKGAGMTSHDVVSRCRRIFGLRRVGHAGTLDPDATGVLLVGLGRATRLLRFLSALPKTYTGEVVLGVATSTLDAAGEAVGEWDMSAVSLDDARRAAAALTGDIEQVPPMVSAVKVGGHPLHKLARQGVEVERAPRPVTVYRFEVAATDDPGVLRIEVECSSGTYVRVLADDLGRALGGGAHLRHLRRTSVGSFGLDEATPVDALGPGNVRSAAEAVGHLSSLTVGSELARRVGYGQVLDRADMGPEGDGPWAVLDTSGVLLAVYEAAAGGRLRPAVVLAAG